jgi:hypothetical protein
LGRLEERPTRLIRIQSRDLQSRVTFSNRPTIARFEARFAAHNSPITSQKSAIAWSHLRLLSLLIGSPLLEIELTHSQQTRKRFLTGGFFATSAPAPHINNRRHEFLAATDPNSENWQSHENTRETIF